MICVLIVFNGGGGVRDEGCCGGNGGDLGGATVLGRRRCYWLLGAGEGHLCCRRLLRSVLDEKEEKRRIFLNYS